MNRTWMRVQRPGGPFARSPRDVLSPVRDRPPLRAGGRLGHPGARGGRSRRTMLGRLALPIVALLLAVSPPTGLRALDAPEVRDAGAFLADLNGRAIAGLAEPGIAQTERERRFRALFNEGFDVPAIGRFVLGRYWRAASDTERAAFLEAFEEVIVRRFTPLFTDYSGVTLSIGRARTSPGKPNIVTVTSRVRRAQGEAVNIEWRMRRRGGRYQIVDVVAEGVSVAITLRSEYTSYVGQHGGDVGALVASLRSRLAARGHSPEATGISALQ